MASRGIGVVRMSTRQSPFLRTPRKSAISFTPAATQRLRQLIQNRQTSPSTSTYSPTTTSCSINNTTDNTTTTTRTTTSSTTPTTSTTNTQNTKELEDDKKEAT